MLSVIEKVIFLQNIDIFNQIPTEQLTYLAYIAKEESYDADEQIYKMNDAPDALYLVIEGKVRMHVNEREIAISGVKDAFGTWALFDEEPRVTSATTLEATKLLSINREDFIDLLADHIQITQGVMKAMVHRLRALVNRVGINPSKYQNNDE